MRVGCTAYCMEFTIQRARKPSIAEGTAINKLYIVKVSQILFEMNSAPVQFLLDNIKTFVFEQGKATLSAGKYRKMKTGSLAASGISTHNIVLDSLIE